MGIEAIPFGDGEMVTGIVHISTVDAVFKLPDGRRVAMEFHSYLGPNFLIDDDCWLPEEGTEEWDSLWRQFDGWWKAKGAAKYSHASRSSKVSR